MKKINSFILLILSCILIPTAHASYVNTCQLTGLLLVDPQIMVKSLSRYDDNGNLMPDVEESDFELDVLVTESQKTNGRADNGCSLANNTPYPLSFTLSNAYALINAKKGDTITFIEIVVDDRGQSETSTEYRFISISQQ